MKKQSLDQIIASGNSRIQQQNAQNQIDAQFWNAAHSPQSNNPYVNIFDTKSNDLIESTNADLYDDYLKDIRKDIEDMTLMNPSNSEKTWYSEKGKLKDNNWFESIGKFGDHVTENAKTTSNWLGGKTLSIFGHGVDFIGDVASTIFTDMPWEARDNPQYVEEKPDASSYINSLSNNKKKDIANSNIKYLHELENTLPALDIEDPAELYQYEGLDPNLDAVINRSHIKGEEQEQDDGSIVFKDGYVEQARNIFDKLRKVNKFRASKGLEPLRVSELTKPYEAITGYKNLVTEVLPVNKQKQEPASSLFTAEARRQLEQEDPDDATPTNILSSRYSMANQYKEAVAQDEYAVKHLGQTKALINEVQDNLGITIDEKGTTHLNLNQIKNNKVKLEEAISELMMKASAKNEAGLSQLKYLAPSGISYDDLPSNVLHAAHDSNIFNMLSDVFTGADGYYDERFLTEFNNASELYRNLDLLETKAELTGVNTIKEKSLESYRDLLPAATQFVGDIAHNVTRRFNAYLFEADDKTADADRYDVITGRNSEDIAIYATQRALRHTLQQTQSPEDYERYKKFYATTWADRINSLSYNVAEVAGMSAGMSATGRAASGVVNIGKSLLGARSAYTAVNYARQAERFGMIANNVSKSSRLGRLTEAMKSVVGARGIQFADDVILPNYKQVLGGAVETGATMWSSSLIYALMSGYGVSFDEAEDMATNNMILGGIAGGMGQMAANMSKTYGIMALGASKGFKASLQRTSFAKASLMQLEKNAAKWQRAGEMLSAIPQTGIEIGYMPSMVDEMWEDDMFMAVLESLTGNILMDGSWVHGITNNAFNANRRKSFKELDAIVNSDNYKNYIEDAVKYQNRYEYQGKTVAMEDVPVSALFERSEDGHTSKLKPLGISTADAWESLRKSYNPKFDNKQVFEKLIDNMSPSVQKVAKRNLKDADIRLVPAGIGIDGQIKEGVKNSEHAAFQTMDNGKPVIYLNSNYSPVKGVRRLFRGGDAIGDVGLTEKHLARVLEEEIHHTDLQKQGLEKVSENRTKKDEAIDLATEVHTTISKHIADGGSLKSPLLATMNEEAAHNIANMFNRATGLEEGATPDNVYKELGYMFAADDPEMNLVKNMVAKIIGKERFIEIGEKYKQLFKYDIPKLDENLVDGSIVDAINGFDLGSKPNVLQGTESSADMIVEKTSEPVFYRSLRGKADGYNGFYTLNQAEAKSYTQKDAEGNDYVGDSHHLEGYVKPDKMFNLSKLSDNRSKEAKAYKSIKNDLKASLEQKGIEMPNDKTLSFTYKNGIIVKEAARLLAEQGFDGITNAHDKTGSIKKEASDDNYVYIHNGNALEVTKDEFVPLESETEQNDFLNEIYGEEEASQDNEEFEQYDIVEPKPDLTEKEIERLMQESQEEADSDDIDIELPAGTARTLNKFFTDRNEVIEQEYPRLKKVIGRHRRLNPIANVPTMFKEFKKLFSNDEQNYGIKEFTDWIKQLNNNHNEEVPLSKYLQTIHANMVNKEASFTDTDAIADEVEFTLNEKLGYESSEEMYHKLKDASFDDVQKQVNVNTSLTGREAKATAIRAFLNVKNKHRVKKYVESTGSLIEIGTATDGRIDNFDKAYKFIGNAASEIGHQFNQEAGTQEFIKKILDPSNIRINQVDRVDKDNVFIDGKYMRIPNKTGSYIIETIDINEAREQAKAIIKDVETFLFKDFVASDNTQMQLRGQINNAINPGKYLTKYGYDVDIFKNIHYKRIDDVAYLQKLFPKVNFEKEGNLALHKYYLDAGYHFFRKSYQGGRPKQLDRQLINAVNQIYYKALDPASNTYFNTPDKHIRRAKGIEKLGTGKNVIKYVNNLVDGELRRFKDADTFADIFQEEINSLGIEKDADGNYNMIGFNNQFDEQSKCSFYSK